MKLADHIVAFADVLGTSAASISEEDSERFVQKLQASHKLVNMNLQPKSHLSWTLFSDSIILSARLSKPDSIPTVLNQLARLQSLFAVCGLFLRGGVTIGRHLHTDSIEFGPALVEAVDIEKHISKDSAKICLSDKLQAYASSFEFQVIRDRSEGNVFLDFMHFVDDPILVDKLRSNIADELTLLQSKNDGPSNRLNTIQKLNWLANYFNFNFSNAAPINCDGQGYNGNRFQRNYVR